MPRASNSVGNVLRQPVREAHVSFNGKVHGVHAEADLKAAEEEDDVDPLDPRPRKKTL